MTEKNKPKQSRTKTNNQSKGEVCSSTCLPMSKVTVIPKGAVACCLKFDAEFSLPIGRFNIPPENI